MTPRILASKIALHRGTRQVYFKQNNGIYAVPSPENGLRADVDGGKPVLRETLAVLGGFALAGLLVLSFLTYIAVVVG